MKDFLLQILNQLNEVSRQLGVSTYRPTWDIFVVLFLILVFFLYGMTAGRRQLLFSTASIFIGYSITLLFPFWPEVEKQTSTLPAYVVRESGFVLFSLAVFLFCFRAWSKMPASIEHGGTRWGWFYALVLSIVFVGALVSMGLTFVPQEQVGLLSQAVHYFFIDHEARFWWMVAALITIGLIGKK